MTKRTKIALGIILAVIVGIFFGGYAYFFGIGKKMKYGKCIKACENSLLMESSKDWCAPRCTEITGYAPAKESSTKPIEKTTTQKNPETAVKNTNKPAIAEEENNVEDKKYIDNKTSFEDREYYCAWVWPQEIIDKNTGEPIFVCPSNRPWCDYGDNSYENAGCCKNYDEATKTKSDCIKLPKLLEDSGIK